MSGWSLDELRQHQAARTPWWMVAWEVLTGLAAAIVVGLVIDLMED